MGFLDDLFTGEGPSLETRSLSSISPEQRASLDALIKQLSGQSGSPRAPGSFVAPLGEGERSSLAALEERSRALAMPSANLEAAGSSVRKQLDFEGQTGDASEYFTNKVQNPLLDSFQREILPQISRQFGGGDFFSTERQQSEGNARNDLLKTLAGEKSAVELDQFNKSRERALTAAGLVPGLEQAESGRTQQQLAILEALGLPREIAQAGLDKSNEENKRVQDLLGQLSLTPTIENIGMTNPGSPGLLNIIAGGAAGGIGGMLGDFAGGKLEDWLGGLFGGSGTGNPNGGTVADGGTGTTVRDIPSGSGGAGGILGGGAAAGGVGAGGVATPGGSTVITEAGGQLAHQIGEAASAIGGAGLGGLVNSVQPGIQAGIAATEAANAAALAGRAAPTLGGTSVAAAESAGAAAGAPAGSGSAIASGATKVLGVAAAVYGAYETYNAAAAGDKKNAVMSGAATGAAIGSIVPGIGTAVGAVVGGIVGLIGASFGNKEKASEKAYGSYKKLPGEASIRNWTQQQADGAMFEAIKSHTKSGNVNKYADVGDMFKAFGINNDAHKNIGNAQTKMKEFIKGVITTSQQAGGLPTDPAALAKLDGQEVYWKLVVPAMAAKVEEATGKAQNGWSTVNKGSGLQNIFADATDYMMANWRGSGVTTPTKAIPRPIKGGRLMGGK